LNLNDPFTRAVAEALIVAAVTLLLLFVVASYVQNVFGIVVACIVAAGGFVFVAHRAKKLMEDYG
jgi:small neutral amino acid transporter SnatA (MarC family)